MKKALIFLSVLMVLSCGSKSDKPVIKISLTDSGRYLRITGISDDVLHEIDRDSVQAAWQGLVSIYKMPADTDAKDFQVPQSGKYSVAAGALMFTPDTPFKKQQTYFVRYYQYNAGNSLMDYISRHKKLGKIPHTDLIFKR